MTTANETLSQESAPIPTNKVAHLSNLWVLYYRHGMNPMLQKVFVHDGTLQEAVKRGRAHCQIMNYKYHFTRPLVFDLESEEAYKLRGGPEQPDS
jgi:hypothetical protein